MRPTARIFYENSETSENYFLVRQKELFPNLVLLQSDAGMGGVSGGCFHQRINPPGARLRQTPDPIASEPGIHPEARTRTMGRWPEGPDQQGTRE